MRTKIALITVGLLAVAGVAVADTPRHNLPNAPNGELVVGLCDGDTSVVVPGKKIGQTLTRGEAQSTSDQLMDQWRKKNPSAGALWDKENRLVAQNAPEKTEKKPPPAAQGGPNPQTGHTYGAYTTRDEQVWRASTDAFIEQGNKIFHDAQAVGGTIGVSCDMCHPNAANTHPETYPKYQVQLGKVALLRDMINWCIENPARGKPLKDDDPKMRAMEAFILAQRKGVALDYGKH